jgi:DNA primase
MSDSTITLSVIVARKLLLVERKPGRFVGLCLFHAERTPSFMVDDATSRFHCLGCGARGDAVDFVLRTEPLLLTAILGRLVDGEAEGAPDPAAADDGQDLDADADLEVGP